MAEAGGTRHVVLVGLMGVGKSTVGRRLAKELERPFVDVDEQVELRAGLAVPALFRRDGEDAFRRLEAEVLADLAGRTDPLVIAAGGGAVNRPENRALLVGRTFVVWLRASPAFVAARVDPTHRPLLAGDPDPVAALARLQAEREPAYAEAADVDVDVEPFHRGEDTPKRALARYIAALVRGEAAEPPAGPPPDAAQPPRVELPEAAEPGVEPPATEPPGPLPEAAEPGVELPAAASPAAAPERPAAASPDAAPERPEAASPDAAPERPEAESPDAAPGRPEAEAPGAAPEAAEAGRA
jgi:shikimate kinase